MSRSALLTDAQWARIESLLPSSVGRRGRPFRDDRRVVEGIIFRFRTGSPWRDVPQDFGPWQTLWKRHRRYSGDGTWDRILARLLREAGAVDAIDWSVSVDSTVNRTDVRVRLHGTGGISNPASGLPRLQRLVSLIRAAPLRLLGS